MEYVENFKKIDAKNVSFKNNIIKNWHILPSFILFLFFFIVPMIMLLGYSFINKDGLSNITIALTNPLYRNIFFRTIIYCVISTLITIFISTPLSLMIVYGSLKIKKLIIFSLLLPIITNPLIMIFGWMFLLKSGGIILYVLSILGIKKILYTPSAVMIGIIYLGLPYMTFPIANSINSIQKNIFHAAHSLGATNFQIFRHLILPLSSSGFLIGSFTVFILSLGYFIIPSLLGGGHVTFISLLIEQQINEMLNWPLASSISIWLILIISILTVLTRKIFIKTISRSKIS